MKTYQDELFGFEIHIPDNWSFHTVIDEPIHPSGKESVLIFKCGANEGFKIQVIPTRVERSVDERKDEFRVEAMNMGYTNLGFGRFTIEGKECFWVRYYEGYGHWTKKYVIVSGGVEYAFIATCLDQKFLLQMEKDWDEVFISFRIPKPAINIVQPGYESADQKEEIAPECAKKSPYVSVKPRLAGMRTCRNEKHGFEIDLPEAWLPTPDLPTGLMDALAGPIPPGVNKDCFQYGCYDEAINFEIGPLYPEPLLEDTEIEFRLYAQVHGFADLHFGRINVAGKEHVCAHYFINDNLGARWNKKYMLVLGGIEYALTCTCNDPQWFAKREKDWDAIIQTFHVLGPIDNPANATAQADRDRQIRRTIVQERIEMQQDPGKMYAKAYQFIALGEYSGARMLLEDYLRVNPDHIQAHKDLAAVLRKLGDTANAIKHLKEVERLDPSDSENRFVLDKLIAEAS